MDRRLLTLMGIVFLDLVGMTIVIPILPSLLLDLQHGIIPIDTSGMAQGMIDSITSERNIILGWLIAVYPMAQFFGAPLLGKLSDIHGRKKILRLSLIGTLAGFILFIFGISAQSLILLFIGRIVDGFTGGNVSIVFSSIADISKPEEKSKNFGLVGMAFGVGFILGPFLGGVLSDPSVVSWFDYSTPFYFTSALTILNIFGVTYFLKETHIPQKVEKIKINFLRGIDNIRLAFKYSDLRLLFTVFFLYAFGFNFFTQFFQVYLIHKFDFTQVQIGNTFGWIGLFIFLAQGLINRKLSMIYPATTLVPVFLMSLSIAILSLWFPEEAYWIYLILPFMAISQAMVSPNLLSIISGKAGDDRQGEILGVNQSVQSVAATIPPLASGFLVNINVGLPIVIGAGLVFLAFLVFVFGYLKL